EDGIRDRNVTGVQTCALPISGWEGEFEWTGFIPFEELPRSYNPESGRIVNANQQVAPDDYPHLLTNDWSEPWRAHRIIELLDAQIGRASCRERGEIAEADGGV